MKITINKKEFEVEQGKTVLDAALENQIDIPFLCFHPDIETKNHCDMCIVQVRGQDEFKRACTLQVEDGMEIITESLELNEARIKNLEKILDKHLLECDDCVWFQHCRLLNLVNRYKVEQKNKDFKKCKVLQTEVMVFDQTKCIGCENCIGVCPTEFLEMNENNKVDLSKDRNKDCVSCGQCVLACPVGAIEGVGEFEELQRMFQDENIITVVQFAPSLRVSIGEELGLMVGEIATGQLVAGLKKIGFDYVFDTALGADFTTMEESDELIERLQGNKNLPAMSSCCPAWVRYLEFNYPEMLPNLCTSRSPQAMLGSIVKGYWAKEKGINKNIFVVSIMPCTAKEFEIKRKELKVDGVFPVDQILTTRELVRLFKKSKIDLKNIEPQEADNPFGDPSGAGVIYGASGGVFESAFRTAYFKMTGQDLPVDAVKEIRGMDGIKKKEIKIGDRVLKVCVVNGLKNAKKIIEELKINSKAYDAVEAMACPGGCVGGGGQSLPTNKKITAERAKSLYLIDQGKKAKSAHQDIHVKEAYDKFLTNKEDRERIFHTSFKKSKKSKIYRLKNSRETIQKP